MGGMATVDTVVDQYKICFILNTKALSRAAHVERVVFFKDRKVDAQKIPP